ncbi:MAG: hypothetical protein QOF51_272, partial [Chloroflexota bacterium]|nr:hypothetical protein [Chloroflexota bacterium]
VPPGDDAQLAGGIARVLDDRDYAIQLSHGGRALAARLSWPAIAQATLAAYARVL